MEVNAVDQSNIKLVISYMDFVYGASPECIWNIIRTLALESQTTNNKKQNKTTMTTTKNLYN